MAREQRSGESIPGREKVKVRAWKIEELYVCIRGGGGGSRGLICKPFGVQENQAQAHRSRSWAWRVDTEPCVLTAWLKTGDGGFDSKSDDSHQRVLSSRAACAVDRPF